MKQFPKELWVEIVPQYKQRYETIGDYFKLPLMDKWKFHISNLRNPDYIFLVLIHELVEWYLCWKRGISEKSITEFDIMFEEERIDGKWKDEEPGDDTRAPYFSEHQLATKVEKLMAKILGVKWNEYEAYCVTFQDQKS